MMEKTRYSNPARDKRGSFDGLHFIGVDAQHQISNVAFTGCRLGDKRVDTGISS